MEVEKKSKIYKTINFNYFFGQKSHLRASFDGAVIYFGQCADTASCALYGIICSLHARNHRQIKRRVPSKIFHHTDFKDVSETFFIAVLAIELPGSVLVLRLMSISIRIELNLARNVTAIIVIINTILTFMIPVSLSFSHAGYSIVVMKFLHPGQRDS